MRTGRLLWTGVFAAAMAYAEAAVVIYLRQVLNVTDLVADVATYDPRIAVTEIGREAATLLMLLAVGWVAGSTRQARLGFALFAFGVWDILYYAWLECLIGWPPSFLTPDVLFLIPLPWWGPVIAPLLVALLCVVLGALLVTKAGRGVPVIFGIADGLMLLAGVAAVLYAFMADALRLLPATALELSMMRPGPFRWPVYLAGLALLTVPVLRALIAGRARG